MKGKLVHRGKVKALYETERPGTYLMEFTDDVTAGDGAKRATLEEKGAVNARMSAALFRYLEDRGIPTHFLEAVDERNLLVRALDLFQLEVVVRNIAAGSLVRRLGLEQGRRFSPPILELYYKDDSLGDPLINDYHAMALGLASREELDELYRLAEEINTHLVEFFRARGITLVDFKLEFGKADGRIYLADEISPDTCRFWDAATGEVLDKDRFRQDLGGVVEAYKEVLERVEE